MCFFRVFSFWFLVKSMTQVSHDTIRQLKNNGIKKIVMPVFFSLNSEGDEKIPVSLRRFTSVQPRDVKTFKKR